MAGSPVDLLDRCRFPPAGTEVTCAVSGGPDSVALLVLAVEAGCRATAVHVDHGLRPGSATEIEVVAAAARHVGAEVRQVRVDVAPGPNLEARARAARRAVLPGGALLGHTADDQAETILLNLLRGAGLDGLTGMRPDHRRPLLALRRTETAGLCADLGLRTVDDPTNRDPRFRRNRVRREVLPLLDEVAERDLVPVLARQADLLAEVVAHLDREADGIDPTDADTLAALPPAVARVVVRRWLRPCSPEHHPPSAAAVDRVLTVARGDAVAAELGGGWRVARTARRLRVERAAH